MFLRNVGPFPNYTALQPEDATLRNMTSLSHIFFSYKQFDEYGYLYAIYNSVCGRNLLKCILRTIMTLLTFLFGGGGGFLSKSV
jgi:hypothetical protein